MDDQEATGTSTFDPADALDATFTAVFDALVPDENSATAGEGADATPVAGAVLDALLLQEKKLELLEKLQEQSLVELTDSLSYRLTDSLPQPAVPLMLQLPKELEPEE